MLNINILKYIIDTDLRKYFEDRQEIKKDIKEFIEYRSINNILVLYSSF
jgi:hypothetical protein